MQIVLFGRRAGLPRGTYIERASLLCKCTRTTRAEHRLMQTEVFSSQCLKSKLQRDRTEQSDSGLTALQNDATLACMPEKTALQMLDKCRAFTQDSKDLCILLAQPASASSHRAHGAVVKSCSIHTFEQAMHVHQQAHHPRSSRQSQSWASRNALLLATAPERHGCLRCWLAGRAESVTALSPLTHEAHAGQGDSYVCGIR